MSDDAIPATDLADPSRRSAALALVAEVRTACARAGEPDPLDEATARLLARADVDLPIWTVSGSQGGGFALFHAGALDLAVAPPARGVGAGARLVSAVAADATVETAWSHADHPAARVLAPRLGLVRSRELWVMRRRTSVPLPALDQPDGARIRSYMPADATEVLRVNAAAFAHHREQGGMDADDLAARTAEPWFDPAGLILVTDVASDRLLAFHWTKRHPPEGGRPGPGEVYVVGVAPEAQGRGLGRLVTLAGLHHLSEVDPVEEVILYVEADNTAARHTYERLGFTHAPEDTHVQYRRPTP